VHGSAAHLKLIGKAVFFEANPETAAHAASSACEAEQVPTGAGVAVQTPSASTAGVPAQVEAVQVPSVMIWVQVAMAPVMGIVATVQSPLAVESVIAAVPSQVVAGAAQVASAVAEPVVQV
jgi:hypothetical protein